MVDYEALATQLNLDVGRVQSSFEQFERCKVELRNWVRKEEAQKRVLKRHDRDFRNLRNDTTIAFDAMDSCAKMILEEDEPRSLMEFCQFLNNFTFNRRKLEVYHCQLRQCVRKHRHEKVKM